MSNIDVNNLSSKELEKLLKQKQKEEIEKRKIEREAYEAERDALIKDLVGEGVSLNLLMKEAKTRTLNRLKGFKEKAEKYGDVRKSSKGGFGLRTSDGTMMVSYDRNTKPAYDERAQMAEELLKEFLEDTVKKTSLSTYRMITALLSRNKKQDYTPARIASLLAIKDNYEDARWVKAMQLFEESYQNIEISYSISFAKKNSEQKDEVLNLSWASL